MTSTTPSVQDKSDKDRVFIFDTTLRDGEQCPGATMTFEEKLEIAAMLDDHGRRRHRGRLPDRLGRRLRGRQRDRQAHQECRWSAGLSRAGQKDIDRCAEAIKPGQARPHPHLPVHLAGAHASTSCRWSPTGGLRSGDLAGHPRPQPHRRRRVVVGRRHPHRIRLPVPLRSRPPSRPAPPRSTFPTPSATRCRRNITTCSQRVRERVPNSDKAIFSVHCHNDLGMAVANSMAGIARRRAADRMHHQRHRRARRQCRAGRSRDGDARCATTNCRTGTTSTPTMLTRASKVVSAATSFPVQYNKAIVGRNAFAHESGIHQDGMLKNAQTYEIMTAGDGRREADLAGDGQAFRPPRLHPQAGGAGLQAGGRTSWKTPSCASRPWPTARSTSTTRTSRRWSIRKSRTPMTASSWCR